MRWLLVMLAGCSFGMTSVPDGYAPRAGGPPPKCSTDGPVVLDVAGAFVFAALAGLAYNWSGQCYAHETDCEKKPAYLVVFGVPSAIYVGSVVRGTVVGGRCRDAKRAHARLQPLP